jgi:hypothetical protein
MIGEIVRSRAVASAPRAAHDPGPIPLAGTARVIPLPPRREIRTLATGMAIAASVAALAVTLILRTATDPAEPAFPLAASTLTVAAPPPTLASAVVDTNTPAPLRDVTDLGGKYEERRLNLNGYLVNFNEQRARQAVSGVSYLCTNRRFRT